MAKRRLLKNTIYKVSGGIVRTRVFLPDFQFNSKTYTHLHIYANGSSIRLTVYDGTTYGPDRSVTLDGGKMWSRYFNTSISFHEVEQNVNKIVESFKAGKVPDDIRLKETQFGDILI